MEEYINKLEAVMDEAPGRSEESELFAQFKPLFEENKGCLSIIRSSLELPIKVVLMGEVKAGKSTLINSILGKKLSRTSVLEATSAIYHFYYSETEECSVITKNGRFKLQNVDKLIEMLEEKNEGEDEAFIKECTNIEIGLNLPILKQFDLIDTPGLGTVTDSNEEITKRYIPWSDIVVWVFNSNYIGQQNIRDYIFDIKDQGKDIIGVLNRIDEVNASPEEIRQSAEKDMPEINTYMPLSAYKEFEKVVKGEEAEGVKGLLETIKAQIGDDIEKKKREVVSQSLLALIEREMGYHDEMIQISRQVQKMINDYQSSIHDIEEEVSDEIQEKFVSWLKYGFLSEVICEINQKKTTLEALHGLEADYLSEDYINETLSEQVNEFCKQLEDNWLQRVKQLDEDCLEELREFAKNLHIEQEKLYTSTALFSEEKHVEELVPPVVQKDNSAIKESLLDSVKIGSALTGYMAFIGPTAASVSILGAAVTVFPIVLAGGLAVGYLRTAYNNHSGKREIETYQGELIEKIRGIKEVLLESDLVTGNHFRTLSLQVEDELINQFLNQSSMKSPLELEGLIKQLEEGLLPYHELQNELIEALQTKKEAQEAVDYKDFNIDDLLG